MIHIVEIGNCTHSRIYCVECDICGCRPDSHNENSSLNKEAAYAVAEGDGWKTNFKEGWDFCNECFKAINEK